MVTLADTLQKVGAKGEEYVNWLSSQGNQIVFLDKAQSGRTTLEDIADSLDEYKRLFIAGVASPGEIITLSRAYPENLEYVDASDTLMGEDDTEDNIPMIVGGPASVELVDREGHLITTDALKKAFKRFMDNFRTRNVMVMHSDVQVGHALPAYISKAGNIFKSGVDDKGLFFIAELRGDTRISNRVQDQIKKGGMKSYSIAGSATKSKDIKKSDGTSVLQVDDLELAEVTICEKGVNQASHFELLKSESITTSKDSTPEVVVINKEDVPSYADLFLKWNQWMTKEFLSKQPPLGDAGAYQFDPEAQKRADQYKRRVEAREEKQYGEGPSKYKTKFSTEDDRAIEYKAGEDYPHYGWGRFTPTWYKDVARGWEEGLPEFDEDKHYIRPKKEGMVSTSRYDKDTGIEVTSGTTYDKGVASGRYDKTTRPVTEYAPPGMRTMDYATSWVKRQPQEDIANAPDSKSMLKQFLSKQPPLEDTYGQSIGGGVKGKPSGRVKGKPSDRPTAGKYAAYDQPTYDTTRAGLAPAITSKPRAQSTPNDTEIAVQGAQNFAVTGSPIVGRERSSGQEEQKPYPGFLGINRKYYDEPLKRVGKLIRDGYQHAINPEYMDESRVRTDSANWKDKFSDWGGVIADEARDFPKNVGRGAGRVVGAIEGIGGEVVEGFKEGRKWEPSEKKSVLKQFLNKLEEL